MSNDTTNKVHIDGRNYYKKLGEWRIATSIGGSYDPYVDECCSHLLDEVERLQAENMTMHRVISEQNRINRKNNIPAISNTENDIYVPSKNVRQDDIVKRLRNHLRGDFEKTSEFLLGIAADEIERLRDVNLVLTEALERDGVQRVYVKKKVAYDE
jgi:hypothetical protein